MEANPREHRPTRIGLLSGKGGTGKTTVAAALAATASRSLRVASADCDVDAANLSILLRADETESEAFTAGSVATMDDPALCRECGRCVEVCRFEALTAPGKFAELFCEGCGVCAYHCPGRAIKMKVKQTGLLLRSVTPYGPLIHGELEVGAGNSGKMVAEIRRRADRWASETGADLVLVDGPPGLGCPVMASLPNLDAVVLVTEPTVSALRDLGRILKLVQHFSIPSGVFLNRCDLNRSVAEDELARLADQSLIRMLGQMEFSEDFFEAVTRGVPVTEVRPEVYHPRMEDLLDRALALAWAGRSVADRSRSTRKGDARSYERQR